LEIKVCIFENNKRQQILIKIEIDRFK